MKRKQRGRERKSLATDGKYAEKRKRETKKEKERKQVNVELKREIMPSVLQLVANNGLTFGRRNRRGRKSDQSGVKPSRIKRYSKDEEKRNRESES